MPYIDTVVIGAGHAGPAMAEPVPALDRDGRIAAGRCSRLAG